MLNIFWWPVDLFQELEQVTPTDKVECLGQIYEGNEEGHLLFAAFLLQLAQGENHVDGGYGSAEAT